MKKRLLPPLMLLLLIACDEAPTIASLSAPSPRYNALSPQSEIVAAANGRVLPAAYASTMGETNNSWPHARANMRYQQVFLGSELGTMDRIAGLCLRHDELFGGRQLSENLTIKLGPTQRDNTNLGNVFDSNYSAAPTQVFSGQITIPATTGAGSVASFDFCIEFTTQYMHPAGSNFIVEIVNTSPSSLTHPKDACTAPAVGCTTRRVVAFSATAAAASLADNMGLVMSFLSADPTEKVDCTEDLWSDFGFRNQGQCIRFVETGKDSRN